MSAGIWRTYLRLSVLLNVLSCEIFTACHCNCGCYLVLGFFTPAPAAVFLIEWKDMCAFCVLLFDAIEAQKYVMHS